MMQVESIDYETLILKCAKRVKKQD